MACTKVISSPTWSNWPCASSSSSSVKLDAARGDSDRASFNSRPTRVEAPAIAILYTGVLLFDQSNDEIYKRFSGSGSAAVGSGKAATGCLRRRRDHE